MPAKAAAEPMFEADPHPLAPALVVGAIAVVIAITFVGTVAAWVFFLQDSGVNWLFSSVK